MVKAINLEHCCTGASTTRVVNSTEVVVEHMVEMTGWLDGNDIEVQRTKEEVYTRKDSKGVPKKVWMWSGWGCNMHRMTLACPIGMA